MGTCGPTLTRVIYCTNCFKFFYGMLLQMDSNCPSGRTATVPGILDSPTLARVERAMLRHEEGTPRENSHRQRQAFTQVHALS